MASNGSPFQTAAVLSKPLAQVLGIVALLPPGVFLLFLKPLSAMNKFWMTVFSFVILTVRRALDLPRVLLPRIPPPTHRQPKVVHKKCGSLRP